MALSTKMQKLMDATVAAFCARLVEKYEGLEVEEMMSLWKETSKNPKGPKKPKKQTAYFNFSQVVRATIKAEHPEMTFGEISTETSKRWKALSEKEKAKYAPNAYMEDAEVDAASPPAETTLVSPVSPQVKSPLLIQTKATKKVNKVKKNSSPKKPSLAELKKLCKEKGFGIKGLKKREEFEELLAACEPDLDDEEQGGNNNTEDEEEEMLS